MSVLGTRTPLLIVFFTIIITLVFSILVISLALPFHHTNFEYCMLIILTLSFILLKILGSFRLSTCPSYRGVTKTDRDRETASPNASHFIKNQSLSFYTVTFIKVGILLLHNSVTSVYLLVSLFVCGQTGWLMEDGHKPHINFLFISLLVL